MKYFAYTANQIQSLKREGDKVNHPCLKDVGLHREEQGQLVD
jgi:hypothetical protein